MLQLKNGSPFQAAINLFPDPDGIDTLYVVIKGSYSLRGTPVLLEEQLPLTMADEYWGDPGLSSLKYASEMHLSKPSTDVVLVGQAWPPRGRPVQTLDVTLSVAQRSKTVRVFGDRSWENKFLGLSITEPAPFKSMPLVYERAYGGIHKQDPDSEVALAEERNPVGVGFLGKRKAKEMAGEPLPNLEDPETPIRKPGDEVTPAGFGFIAPTWLPRRKYAGTYDEAWQKKRMPILPEDFDSRFFNMAHPDLIFGRYLEGGEPVQIKNASPEGSLRFRVPACEVELEVQIAGSLERPELNLETLLIEPDDERFSLVWRAAVPCDKKALKVQEIRIRPRVGAPGK